MSVLAVFVVIAAFVLALVVAIIRALAIDEVRGRIQRRVEKSVEATIASLPEEQRAEWGDEWRAEIAAMKSMPFTAIAFARGLRQTAGHLDRRGAALLTSSPATRRRRYRPRRRSASRPRRLRPQEVRLPDVIQGADDRLSHLRIALEALPTDQREVLILRHIAGLSPLEIADALDKTESSIHGLHHRGRSALRARLTDLGSSPPPSQREV